MHAALTSAEWYGWEAAVNVEDYSEALKMDAGWMEAYKYS